jgi:hypothetical protein
MLRKQIVYGLTALSVAGGLIIAACAASGHIEAEGQIGPVKAKVELTVPPGGGTSSTTNSSEKCFEITYVDANGHDVGKVIIRPGSSHGAVPAGAVTWIAVEVPCPQQSQGTTSQMANIDSDSMALLPPSTPVILPLPYFEISGGPLVWDSASPSGNAMYHFNIQASNAGAALNVALATINSPIGTPVSGDVKVWTWVRTVPGTTSSTVVALAQRQFTSFQLDVNGTINYADLASGTNCSQAQLPSGTWMVSAVVDNARVNPFDVGNTFDARLNHGALPAGPETVHANLITSP